MTEESSAIQHHGIAMVLTLGADWNNISFSVFFQGVGKQQWYPSTETEMFWGQYNRPYNNIPIFHLGNMWTPENTNAYFPRTMSRAASSSNEPHIWVLHRHVTCKTLLT